MTPGEELAGFDERRPVYIKEYTYPERVLYVRFAHAPGHNLCSFTSYGEAFAYCEYTELPVVEEP